MEVTRLRRAMWEWQSLMGSQVEKASLSQLRMLKFKKKIENFLPGEQLGGKRAAMQYYHDRFEAHYCSLRLIVLKK